MFSPYIDTEKRLGKIPVSIPALTEAPDLSVGKTLSLSALLSAGESSVKESQKQGSSLLIEGDSPHF